MSLSTLDTVLARISPKIDCQVYTELRPSLGIIYRAEPGMEDLISGLDKITNNSGMQIISIAIWPGDEVNEWIEKFAAEVVANCAAIDRVEPSNA